MQSPQNRIVVGLITGGDKGRHFSAALSRDSHKREATREGGTLKSQPSAQRRRPPSNKQVPPEVYKLLKLTHPALKRNGFRVKADLWSLDGDNKGWVLGIEPPDKVPKVINSMVKTRTIELSKSRYLSLPNHPLPPQRHKVMAATIYPSV